MTQTRLTGRLSGFVPDFIGRFEDFTSDFNHLKYHFYDDKNDDDYQNFGKHHSSNADEKLESYYGEEERKIVRDIYAADFVIFRYMI